MLNYQRVQRAFFQNMSLKHVVRTPQNEVDLLLAFASSTANGAFCSLRPWWLGLHQVAEGGSHGSHSDPIRMTLGKPRQCFTWVFFCSFDVFSMVKVALFDVKNMKVIFLSFFFNELRTNFDTCLGEVVLLRMVWNWIHYSTSSILVQRLKAREHFNFIFQRDCLGTDFGCLDDFGVVLDDFGIHMGASSFHWAPPFFIGLKKSPNPWIIWVWINTY